MNTGEMVSEYLLFSIAVGYFRWLRMIKNEKGVAIMNFCLYFNSIEEIVTFVNEISKFPYQMDLSCGSYNVDAKSILGVMSIGIKKRLLLHVYEEYDDLNGKLMKLITAYRCCENISA